MVVQVVAFCSEMRQSWWKWWWSDRLINDLIGIDPLERLGCETNVMLNRAAHTSAHSPNRLTEDRIECAVILIQK